MSFEEDCKNFEILIEEGRKLAKSAPSIQGFSLNEVSESEKNGFKWFTKTRNFLTDLFGEDFRDVKTFRSCFGRYKTMNFSGFYTGTQTFIREDVSKGLGVLEGLNESFKLRLVKRKKELMKSLLSSPDIIKVMFDNDILNKMVEGELDSNRIILSKNFKFYATHIQTDQLSACKDEEKRKKLSLLFASLKPEISPTESFVLGHSRLGYAKLGDAKDFEKIKKGNDKNIPDALIGEVAIKNKILLVTNDKILKSRVNSEGGRAINLIEFKELLK